MNNLLETGPLQVDALCLHWSTERNSKKFCLVVLLLNDKVLPPYFWNCGLYLFCCCCLPSFHVCCEWLLESTILTFSPYLHLVVVSERSTLLQGCCLFFIVEKTSFDFCLLFAVLTTSNSNLSPNKICAFLTDICFFALRSFFVFLESTVVFFRALKHLVYKIILKAWPSNVTVWSKFVRISGIDTSTCSKWELLAFSTVVQTLDKRPITSRSFCCSLTKFESAVTSRLPALYSNLQLKCFRVNGINLLKWSFMYLAKFTGRSHLNSSCFGNARILLKSKY